MMLPPFEYPQPITDWETGYSINIPLGLQATTDYWDSPAGQIVKERIVMLRAEQNIDVPDDMLDAPKDVHVETFVDALDYYRNGGK